MDGIDVNTISAYATAAGAIFAGLALIYNAIQTKAAKDSSVAARGSYEESAKQSRTAAETLNQSAKVYYYQMLKDFNDQIEGLQASQCFKYRKRNYFYKV